MVLDPNDSLLLSVREVYEPIETAFFKRNVRAGHRVIDIGANIGYYTLIFARQVGSEGHVYGFEPEPENFALLTRNVALNKYSNVTLENAAISSSEGILDLYLNENNRGDHQLYDAGDARTCVRVKTTSIDAYFQRQDIPIDFIKMDIQGWEPAAIEGMKELLVANHHLVLVTEFWPQGMVAAGHDPGTFISSLVELGFKIFQCDENRSSICPVDIDEIVRVHDAESGSGTNLICCRVPERLLLD